MNLRHLETFVQVAELGSFSRAALVLGVAQPALSRQVRALETELHQALLVRTGRGVEPTDAGRRLREHALAVLERLREAQADLDAARDAPGGRAVVGLPPTLARRLTLALVERFRAELPGARLALVEGLSTHIVEWIATGRCDVGLVYSPDANPAIALRPLAREPLMLVSPAAGRPAAGANVPAATARAAGTTPARAVALAELAGRPLILPERGHVIRRLLDTLAAQAGVRLDVALEVSSVASIPALVAAGHGHAVLHAGAIGAGAEAGRLSLRPLGRPAIETVLCLATPAHKRGGALTRRAADLVAALAASDARSA